MQENSMLDLKKITDQRHLILDAAVSLIIIIAIFWMIGIDEIIKEFSSLNYFYLALSVVSLLLMYLGMTMRLSVILSDLGHKIPFWNLFKTHVVGMLLADFTPARTGYLAVAYHLHKKHHVPEGKSLVAVLGPQIYDFMLKAIVGTLGLLYLIKYYVGLKNSEFLFLGAFIMGDMISGMMLMMFSKRFLELFSFARKISIADKVLSIFESAQKESKIIIHKFPALLALLLFCWAMKGISWYFVAKSLGISIDAGFPELLFYFFLQPLLTILEFIPSPTLAGLGLSEGGGVLIFSIFGIGAAKAASFVFLARVKTTIVNLTAIGEAISLIKPNRKTGPV